ncbi:MAG: universal stress protein [Gammaproteobacteria bacterium]|nr:universal stress protein [Gammaproteobacteria bacterium]
MNLFQNILLVSDGVSEEAEAYKQALSQARNRQARMSVLVTCPPFPAELSPHQAAFQQFLRERVQQQVAATRELLQISERDLPVSIEMTSGESPANEVIRHVLRRGHDLLVKQTGPGGGRSGFGAFDMDLLRKCPCAMWLSRPILRSRHAIEVAVAVDPESPSPEGHDLAVHLLRTARTLADECNGTLRVVACWDFPFEEYLRGRLSTSELQRAVAGTGEKNRVLLDALVAESGIGGDLRLAHLRGQPEERIPAFVLAEGIDILVMGTVARTGIPGWLMGNTAEGVLHDLNCSLLALKPRGYVSPLKAC